MTITKKDLENNPEYWKEKYENIKFHYEKENQKLKANLIAAAPDMLEALKECLESLKVFVRDGHIMSGTKAENLVRAAITKAEKGE